MDNSKDMAGYGDLFLRSVLTEEDTALGETVDRMGGGSRVILLSCFLAIVLRETLGPSLTLARVAEYAREITPRMESNPRRLVVEDVLRTGAGFEVLSGLGDEERLVTTEAILRYIVAVLERRSISKDILIDRALRLASSQASHDPEHM